MEKLEKVIKGLETCVFGGLNCNKNSCPYNNHELCNPKCIDDVMVDALNLLKARVMTLEEADEADVCWLEVKNAGRIVPIRVAVMKIGSVSIGRFRAASETAMASDYGTIWRCWSARPTNAQREAVKWE